MAVTDQSDVIELLTTLLKENENQLDNLAKRLEIVEKTVNKSPLLSEGSNKKVSRTILVIDDDVKLANSFKLVLESEGYIVDTAYTGSDALFMMKKKAYDLIFLDFYLPDILGDKVAEQIEKRHKDSTIVFISGYSSFPDGVEEDDLLVKPIDPDNLLRTAKKKLK